MSCLIASSSVAWLDEMMLMLLFGLASVSVWLDVRDCAPV